jgi:hypothetical protein
MNLSFAGYLSECHIFVLEQAQKDALSSGLITMQDVEMMATGMVG